MTDTLSARKMEVATGNIYGSGKSVRQNMLKNGKDFQSKVKAETEASRNSTAKTPNINQKTTPAPL